jgi:CheY-like chemotaxis protein
MPIKKEKSGARPSYRFPTVMLIDDSEIDNFINQKVIESNYFAEKIYVNTGGISALEFLKNLTVNEELMAQLLPKVIFIDLNMPLMDGFQFIGQFLQLPSRLNKQTKLVILTSSFNPEDKEKANQLFKEVLFLNKPLTDEGLALVKSE